MATLADFIRSTPPASLHAYFNQIHAALPAEVVWDAPANDIVAPLLRAVDSMDDASRLRVMNDAERVGVMADEAGQAALYNVAPDRDTLDDLANGHDRALWMFLHHREAFGHAEEVRYADNKRYGRMWDGFAGEPGLAVPRQGTRLTAFAQAVGNRFESRQVQVEICDRTRPALDEPEAVLIQATVYRQGPAGDVLEFVDGRVARRPHRPVIEAAITYEPADGTIEVVAAVRETREELVRLFAEHLLSVPFEGGRVPIRRFDLEVLRQPFAFPTDPEDGIESVRVSYMRLQPYNAQGLRFGVECQRGVDETIWEAAAAHLKHQEHGIEGYLITQVRFTIWFVPVPGVRGGRTLPVTITMPKGCDLKDRTDRERLIGEKYLRRWGLRQDV